MADSQISVSRYKGLGIIIGRINAFEIAERDGGSGDAEIVDVDVDYSDWSNQATMI